MLGQKRAREPVLGDPDREDYLREQYHTIRNAHLAHPLPALAERDAAPQRRHRVGFRVKKNNYRSTHTHTHTYTLHYTIIRMPGSARSGGL